LVWDKFAVITLNSTQKVIAMPVQKWTVLFTIISCLSACGGSSSTGTTTTAPTRAFAMGFTPFPYDYSSDPTTAATILDNVYTKLANDADLIAHHFDNGIPWNAALTDTYPYDAHIMSDWQTRFDKTPASDAMYVAITHLNADRTGLAKLRDTADDMTLTSPFAGYAAAGDFNNPDVETAYLNYCKRVIAFFNPDYLAIGIEVNLLRKNTDAATWARYVALNHYVYTHLKALYPNLTIFVSVSPIEAIEGYVGPSAEFSGDPAGYAASQVSAINDVLADSDDYAISLYPYMSVFYNSAIPTDMLDNLFALSSKPIVIAETGMLAKNIDITVNSTTLTFTGSDTAQNDYLSLLLQKANDYHAQFVNWFILQDYDQLCVALGGCTDTQNLWRNTGLYDSAGNSRASYTTWTQWLARSQM
jgi:hypothetical protein